MAEPHTYIADLADFEVNQYLIAEKLGVNQSTISRMKNKKFEKIDYRVVNLLEKLHTHVCIEKRPLKTFKGVKKK
ncbi:MAG: hypothetical protein Q4P13_09590 [Psychrobacter sp.]|nr:hypothetical protein [Psychrobacter sp.]